MPGWRRRRWRPGAATRFIINLLPIHCLASIFTGRLTAKLYIAYAPLIVLGTIEAGESNYLLWRPARLR